LIYCVFSDFFYGLIIITTILRGQPSDFYEESGP